MSYNLKNKKLLILGGSYQHVKLVKAAKELGIKTYVTDYLPIEKSPAKQIADVPLMYNITDINGLEIFCKEECIDGVIGPYLDVTQIPCLQLCERLGYPCFGTKEQYKILTDKFAFKKFCQENGADIINSYTEDDVLNHPEMVNFPILIKPCDSRGSRGQTICYNFNEVHDAINFAKECSNSKNFIIEEYMGNTNDVEMAYIVINKEPIFIRILDRYLGSKENGFDKLAIAEVFPSKFNNKKFDIVNKKIKNFISHLGLINSPVFLQAFIDNNVARLYDPGIRFPGDDFDNLYKVITGIDVPQALVIYALTGGFSKRLAEKFKIDTNNKPAAMIWPCLNPGTISKIEGYDELKENKNFISFSKAYSVGDTVMSTKDVRQRFGEFCIVCENFTELKNTIDKFFIKLNVLDENGKDMIIEKFDTNILTKYNI